MSRAQGRRGLILVALLLLGLLIVVDLLRADSFLLGAWGGAQDSGTPLERFMRNFMRGR